jgi:hypothetical protein
VGHHVAITGLADLSGNAASPPPQRRAAPLVAQKRRADARMKKPRQGGAGYRLERLPINGNPAINGTLVAALLNPIAPAAAQQRALSSASEYTRPFFGMAQKPCRWDRLTVLS